MKKAIVGFILILGAIFPWACSQSSYVQPSTPYNPTSTFTPSSPTATFTITHTPTVTPTATITNTPTVTFTPTVTITPGGPVTISVSIITGATNGDNPFGYYYTATGFTNDPTTSTLNVTAHVGDTIILPTASIHPLYFDAGSTTCIDSGISSGAPQTFTFSSTGTYYFHCGNHATNCSLGLGVCGSTNCTGLSGVVTVP